MSLVELTRVNFKRIVDQKTIVLVECWAVGCGACRQFDPIFEKVASFFSNCTFARMNVHTDEKLGEFFEIAATPTILLYRDGLLLFKKPGIFTEEALKSLVGQAESLDMAMVRAELESSELQTPEERNSDE